MSRITMTNFENKYNLHFTRNHRAKMSGLASLSTSPLCNPNCQKRVDNPDMICAHCFSMNMNSYMHGLRENLIDNSNTLYNTLIPQDEMPFLISETGFFRFESFGDLATPIQAANYFRMAAANPHMDCALWTKNPWLIQQAIETYGIEKPANLTIIGSSYFVNKPMDSFYKQYDFIDYVFTVYDKKYIKENDVEITCGARSCATCGKCYERKHSGYGISEKLK